MKCHSDDALAASSRVMTQHQRCAGNSETRDTFFRRRAQHARVSHALNGDGGFARRKLAACLAAHLERIAAGEIKGVRDEPEIMTPSSCGAQEHETCNSE